MATNRNAPAQTRPYRPALASTRTTERSPLTPRLAVHSTASAPVVATRKTLTSTPRAHTPHDNSRDDDGFDSENVTPRSAKRRSRVEASGSNNNTPTQSAGTPDGFRAHTASPLAVVFTRSDTPSSTLSSSKVSTSRSPLSDAGSAKVFAPFVRSSAGLDHGVKSSTDDLDSRFFHASDAAKIETEAKRPEVKRPAAFFYADGQQEQRTSQSSTRTSSPVRSEKRLSSQWQQPAQPASIRSPPAMLSPALSAISSSSPFFAQGNPPIQHKPRSPSPPKENIHLSYRKGASQIFGSRPSPIPSPRNVPDPQPERRPSFRNAIASHRKSPSLSSIDSGLSHNSRRRSDGPGSSPLAERDGSASPHATALTQSPPVFPIIETSLDIPSSPEPKDAAMSPTKSVAELAADARRERKVLDLEISNSSLLAINTSLEREIRRQKAELKRFRRLSRAGRFSFAPLDGDRSSLGLISEDGTDSLDADFAAFGPSSGLSDLYEDMSDSDDERSSLTSGDAGSLADAKQDRLAKDDQRLRADLEKHKELLVQSQLMNQSIRRCTYATEEMIKDGRKALDYKIRVSDIKLGGRVLSGLDDEEDESGHRVQEIEVEDDFEDAPLASPLSPAIGIEDNAQGFMALWGGVGRSMASNGKWSGIGRTSLEESEGGDRDSGIEVDRPSLVMASTMSGQ